MTQRKAGRKRGSKNRGFFFRARRGWYAKDAAGRMVPLADENGERLRDENTPATLVKDAYARFRLVKQAAAGSSMNLWDLAEHYFAHIERTGGAAATLKL
ncbi:MAG TPA: hypothetical protein VHY20_16090, partial [Pirellulales bacterium]|nr:hypothetical protein [Pirellulales bacterium]